MILFPLVLAACSVSPRSVCRLAHWLGLPASPPRDRSERVALAERIAIRCDPWLTIDDLHAWYPDIFQPIHLPIPRDSRPHSLEVQL